MTCTCHDAQGVRDVVIRYARCLDTRDWPGLERVFVEDATASYGGRALAGRESLVRWVAGFLDGCGPSQHLLGNHEVHLDGDRATCETQARVIHLGAGARAALAPYESIGTYRDELRRTVDGWRIVHRDFEVRIEVGDPAVLAGTRPAHP